MPGFYYRRGNQKFGPVSAARLKQLAAAGELGSDDLVAQEGSAKWYEARTIKGLFPAATPQHGQQALPVAQVSERDATPTPLCAEVVADSSPGAGATYVPCFHCHNYLIATADTAGRAIQCPHCGAAVQIPGAAAPAALADPVPAGSQESGDILADLLANPKEEPSNDAEPFGFLDQSQSSRTSKTTTSFRATKKPASVWGEAVGELSTSVKGEARKATKFAIKAAILFVVLILLCSGLAFLGNLGGNATRGRNATGISTRGGMTKEQLKQRLRGLGWRGLSGGNDPVKVSKLKSTLGPPDKTQSVGDNQYWYWNCQDGVVQLVLFCWSEDDAIIQDCNDH